MIKKTSIISFLFSVFFFGCVAPSSKDSDEKIITKAYQQLIATQLKPISNTKIKVVYFYGADSQPLNNWKERLNRTLNDVSKFYQQEFLKHNVKIQGLPFEQENGEISFNIVKADGLTKSYNLNSGPIIKREISIKTNRQINFDKDHVLIITALSDKTGPRSYNFHSPYYGEWGEYSSDRGACIVPDCELLDSNNLIDTGQQMTFSEWTVKDKRCSVAEFNGWYIGGIAHEMGHMLGLRHDYWAASEMDRKSISLMGEGGSRHYKADLWRGGNTSVLSAAAVFQLISHPLFINKTAVNDVLQQPGLQVKYQKINRIFQLHGAVTANKPFYGAVLLIRPIYQSEYFSRSAIATISNQAFDIDLGRLLRGLYHIKILLLSIDGKIIEINKYAKVDLMGQLSAVKPNSF